MDEAKYLQIAKRNQEEVGKEARDWEDVEGVEERQEVVQVEPLLTGSEVELLLSGGNKSIGHS